MTFLKSSFPCHVFITDEMAGSSHFWTGHTALRNPPMEEATHTVAHIFKISVSQNVSVDNLY